MAATEDLTKNKKLLSDTDVIESCTRERATAKCKFYKLTDVTFFAASLKEVPMGCKDTVLPDPPLRIIRQVLNIRVEYSKAVQS